MNADERDPLTGTILSAAFEVANTLGHGFLEKVYQRALVKELTLRRISAQSEVSYPIHYKGELVASYCADLVVEGKIIVELKCAEALAPAHISQCLNYLRASRLKTSLLINFGRPKLEYRRITL